MAEKKATLQSAEYKILHQSFTEWLQLLGYSPLSIPALSGTILHFLCYLEQQNKPELLQLEATDANHFIGQLQQQTGVRTGKPLSSGHINKQVQSLKLFSRYIRETGKNPTGFNLQRMEEQKGKPVWLTKAEIQRIYEAIPDTILGIRDKAMLAIYYGCGLRLNEGASLELHDLDTTKKMLHVRKGKHYKERFVPVAEKNYEEIKIYLDYARPQLLQEIKTTALFIDCNKGKPLTKQSLYIRIKKLVKKAGIAKKVGAHTLRHSIATHLLHSGMKLERIQQFLGHSDLGSTQIYTHLKNELP